MPTMSVFCGYDAKQRKSMQVLVLNQVPGGMKQRRKSRTTYHHMAPCTFKPYLGFRCEAVRRSASSTKGDDVGRRDLVKVMLNATAFQTCLAYKELLTVEST